MSADRVTVTKRNSVGVSYVRYGSPSSFETLGLIEHYGSVWYARPSGADWTSQHRTKADAVSAIVEAARL